MPLPAAPTPTHHFLERKRSIANARHKFALVAVRCRALPQQMPAFASTMATTSCLSPLPNDPMQVDVPRERASPNPCLSSPRFRTDRGRQRRSNANWLSWPHAQPVIDKDDVLAAAPPLYLPMHQQALFTSFIVFATSATTCTNVHYVWRAITVCCFTTRSVLGATMRCVRTSHWFVLSLTLKYRPFTGR